MFAIATTEVPSDNSVGHMLVKTVLSLKGTSEELGTAQRQGQSERTILPWLIHQLPQ